jgi:large-conductance mechanosensitive channel
LTVALNFLIIAWVLFLAIRGINKLKKDLLRPPAEIETDLGRADRAKKLGGCLFAAR